MRSHTVRTMAAGCLLALLAGACGGGHKTAVPAAAAVPQEFRDAVTVTSVAGGIKGSKAKIESAFEDELFGYFSRGDTVSRSSSSLTAPMLLGADALGVLRSATPADVEQAMQYATVRVTARFSPVDGHTARFSPVDGHTARFIPSKPCCSVSVAYGSGLKGSVDVAVSFADKPNPAGPCCGLTRITTPAGDIITPQDAAWAGAKGQPTLQMKTENPGGGSSAPGTSSAPADSSSPGGAGPTATPGPGGSYPSGPRGGEFTPTPQSPAPRGVHDGEITPGATSTSTPPPNPGGHPRQP